jgi:thioredoxin-like negative regulator of GroEL
MTLMQCIKLDKNWENGKAKASLIELLNKLGAGNEIAINGRRALSKLLF